MRRAKVEFCDRLLLHCSQAALSSSSHTSSDPSTSMEGLHNVFVVTEANIMYREHRICGPNVVGMFETMQDAKAAL